jgi:hypothetical protein
MNYTADFFMLDKFKTVIDVQTRPANSGMPAASGDKIMYALVVPSGALSNLGVQAGDPMIFGETPGMVTGSYVVAADDGLTFHS